MRRLLLAFAAAAASLAPAAAAQAGDLLVFAAASTKNAIDDIIAAYAAQGSADQVEASYASSSDLAKQIENGAPAGVYISADTKWADYLAERLTRLVEIADRAIERDGPDARVVFS